VAGKWSKARQKPRDLAYKARTSPDMWSDERGKALNAAVQSLDQVARAMEQKWGYGTLERLASPDLAAKFNRAKENLQAACDGDDHNLVIQKCENMAKGWRLLDRKATEAGCKPLDERVVLHIADSGQKYAFTNESGLYKLIADKYGPDVRVMSFDEVTRIMEDWHKSSTLLNGIKDAFPGSEVTKINPKSEGKDLFDDEIPF